MNGAWIFPLEPRLLLSDPSAREQYMLQLINRARMDPVDELPLILNSNDKDIQDALKYFNVDKSTLQQQWTTLTAVPPLAWNNDLATAATGHTQLMLQNDMESHQFPGEPELATRETNAGYTNYSYLGENVYNAATSVFMGDASFLVDWGDGPGGMQSPPGHRQNIYSANFSEVGISILDTTAGKASGPLLMTEDFGSRFEEGNPYLLGAAFSDDVTADNFYTPGEGLAGLTITATSTTSSQQFMATTNSAGGYEMQLPADTYDVTASGTGLSSPITHNNVVVGASNVETDFEVPAATPPDTTAPTITANTFAAPASGATSLSFTVTFSDDTAVNASTIQTGTLSITLPDGSSVTPTLTSNALSDGISVLANYTLAAPNGTFTSADNGTYTLQLVSGGVADTSGNLAAAVAKVASFKLSLSSGGGGGGGGGGAASLQASFAGKIPGSLKPAQKAKISLKINNTGGGTGTAGSDSLYLSTDNTFDSSDLQVATASYPAIAAKKSKTVAFNFTSPLTLADENYYFVAVNNGTQIAASSSAVHIIAPTTNLVPSLAGALKLKNSMLPITVKVKNTGNYIAMGSVSLTFALRPTAGGSDVPMGSASFSDVDIKANGTTSLRSSFDLPPDLAAGSYKLVATLDSDLSIPETTTADNTAVSVATFVVS